MKTIQDYFTDISLNIGKDKILRKAIYSHACKIYTDMLMEGTRSTICYCLKSAVIHICNMEYIYFEIQDMNLHEFNVMKPADKSWGEYWWSVLDINPRLESFKQLIES